MDHVTDRNTQNLDVSKKAQLISQTYLQLTVIKAVINTLVTFLTGTTTSHH